MNCVIFSNILLDCFCGVLDEEACITNNVTTSTEGTERKDQEIPDLPEGLAIHYREDLITEVKKIMDDPYERDVSKITDSPLILCSIG